MKKIGLKCDDLIEFFKEVSFLELMKSQMAQEIDIQVRLYLIGGFDFASRDIGGFSDPYCVVRCGKKVFSGRKEYQLDEPNPYFFKCYEFNAKSPGSPNVEILAYDYDDLFGDDLIGKTSIDIDDRWFSPDWKQTEYKLIEQRELYHPSSELAQGTVSCWLDAFVPDDESKLENKMFDINPDP